jgi:hypothetical protein
MNSNIQDTVKAVLSEKFLAVNADNKKEESDLRWQNRDSTFLHLHEENHQVYGLGTSVAKKSKGRQQ